jgi:hypothetical protein
LDTAGSAPSDMDQSLHISIDRLLQALPALPPTAAELFDEKALLDEVFGAAPAATPGKRQTSEILPVKQPQPEKPPPAVAWNIFKPLLGEEAESKPLLSGSGRATSSYGAVDSRTTYGRLRAYTDRLGARGTALWLLIWTLVVITCAAIGGVLYSGYNAAKLQHQSQQ